MTRGSAAVISSGEMMTAGWARFLYFSANGEVKLHQKKSPLVIKR
jgi:hypothetical protein